MKQDSMAILAFPRTLPRTLLGAYRWHRRLLTDCLYNEFKKKALEKSIDSSNDQIRSLVRSMKDGKSDKGVVTLALKELHRLSGDLKEQLSITKETTKVLHDTNEFLISNLLNANGLTAYTEQLKTKPLLKSTNLLHGLGWVFELEGAQDLEKKGKVAFLTFGTMYDPAGVDIIAFEKPLARIKWKKTIQRRKATKS